MNREEEEEEGEGKIYVLLII